MLLGAVSSRVRIVRGKNNFAYGATRIQSFRSTMINTKVRSARKRRTSSLLLLLLIFFDSSRGCKINQGVAINSKEPDVLSFGKYTEREDDLTVTASRCSLLVRQMLRCRSNFLPLFQRLRRVRGWVILGFIWTIKDGFRSLQMPTVSFEFRSVWVSVLQRVSWCVSRMDMLMNEKWKLG